MRDEFQEMNNPLHFFVDLFHAPAWVSIWVGWLMVINLAGILFWHQREARVVLFTFLASAMMMMGLYTVFGFERILGLGHVLWIPLLVYLLVRVGGLPESRLRAWVWTVVISNFISLVLDARDVWLYATA